MGFFSRFCGITAFSMAAGAAANGVHSTYTSKYRLMRHSDDVAFNTEYYRYRLGEVFNIAEDVAVFRFLLRNPDHVFDLPPCSTLQCMMRNGEFATQGLQRNYTPITANGEKGYFDILVKKQPNGRMTEHLFALSPGEYAEFRCRMYKLAYQANDHKHIGMIAGGTGITPMLQVMRAVVDNPTDKTKVNFVFANRSESKILLKGLLDDLELRSNGRLVIDYAIDVWENNKDTWKGFFGHVDQEMLTPLMPPSSDPDALVLLCGPDSMMQGVGGCGQSTLSTMSKGANIQGMATSLNNLQHSFGGVLGNMGYTGEQVYRF